MKIYNKLVISMSTGKTIKEDSYEYIGRIMACKGGGGSSTTTVDPVYNAGMLALSQEQQDWAREIYGVFTGGVRAINPEWQKLSDQKSSFGEVDKYIGGPGGRVINPEWEKLSPVERRIYSGVPQFIDGPSHEINPEWEKLQAINAELAAIPKYLEVPEGQISELDYMQNVISANQSLLSEQTALERSQMGLAQSQIGAAQELLPGQTGLAKSQMGIAEADIAARHELLPGQTALSKLQMSDTTAGIHERAPVRAKYYGEALKGVNVKERMGLAQADVAQSFAGAEGTARRKAARMGLNPANIDFGQLATDRAKAIGSARTTARVGAKEESFKRLQSAVGVV